VKDSYSTAVSAVQTAVEDPELVEQRRAQLIAAATKRFARFGYHSTTIKDIATEAGVSPGLIYQYVKDKHDLLFLTLMHVVNENRKKIPPAIHSTPDPVLRFVAVFRTYCSVIDENRHAVMLTYREGRSLSSEYRQALKQMEIEQNVMISEVVAECIAKGYFRPVSVEVLTYHVILMSHGWATKYWRFRDIITLKDYIAENVSLTLNSVLTAEGRERYGHLIQPGNELPRANVR
jgi:AcrR family transcriptional regulator